MLMDDGQSDLQITLPGAATTVTMGRVAFFPTDCLYEIEWPVSTRRVLRCTYGGPSRHRELDSLEIGRSFDIRWPAVSIELERLAAELLSPGWESKALSERIMFVVGLELGRYFRSLPARSAVELSAQQMERINLRIDMPGVMPTAAELAAECQISRRHLFRLFQKTTGKPLARYMMERRINSAREMLSRHDLPTKQIAYLSGFSSVSAFYNAFRRTTGRTPRAFRENAPDVSPRETMAPPVQPAIMELPPASL